ncbi:hypothetical protein NADFUDRAFT_83659, partial [Nadsonia fulvescens var. elongata DSM 6958]
MTAELDSPITELSAHPPTESVDPLHSTTLNHMSMSLAMNLASGVSPSRRISNTSSNGHTNCSGDRLDLSDTTNISPISQSQSSPRSDSFFSKSPLSRAPLVTTDTATIPLAINIPSGNGITRSNSDRSLRSMFSANSGHSFHSDHVVPFPKDLSAQLDDIGDDNDDQAEFAHPKVSFQALPNSSDTSDFIAASNDSADNSFSPECAPTPTPFSCSRLEIPGFKDLRPFTNYSLDFHLFQSHQSHLKYPKNQLDQSDTPYLPEVESDIGFYRAIEIETNTPKIIKLIRQTFDPYLPDVSGLVSSNPDSTSASNSASVTAMSMGMNTKLLSHLEEDIQSGIELDDSQFDRSSPLS